MTTNCNKRPEANWDSYWKDLLLMTINGAVVLSFNFPFPMTYTVEATPVKNRFNFFYWKYLMHQKF